MRSLAKRIARLLLGEYRLNRIYRLDLTVPPVALPDGPLKSGRRLTSLRSADMKSADDARLREHAWYGGDDAIGFGVWEGGDLVSATWFWNNRRFRDSGIWTFGDDEAIMVDLLTAESHRGQGLAPVLTTFAAQELRKQSFRALYTWVWHSHRASIRTFEKAGWTYIAFVAEANLLRLRRIRLVRDVGVRPCLKRA